MITDDNPDNPYRNYNNFPSIPYYDIQNAKGLATALLSFGVTSFYYCYRVINIEKLKELLNRSQQKLPPNVNDLYPFAINNVFDSVRIVTCFENYMKSVLLINGYIVHKINFSNPIYKKLKGEQRDRPINLKELRSIEDFVKVKDKPFEGYLPGITNHTIQMSNMLQPKYQSVINISTDILRIIQVYNEYRNNLHFFYEERFHIDANKLNEIMILWKFIDNTMKPLKDKIENELKF